MWPARWTIQEVDPQFLAALRKFEAISAQDPARETDEHGQTWPKEQLYSARMQKTLQSFAPQAGLELHLAVAAQHLGRFSRPRTDFAEGRKGYKEWRTQAMAYHAKLAEEILTDLSFPESVVTRVGELIRKQNLRNDHDAQTLEDVACLVFLQYEFAAFAPKVPREKLVHIVAKTWNKMSQTAHDTAAKLPLPDDLASVVSQALSSQPKASLP